MLSWLDVKTARRKWLVPFLILILVGFCVVRFALFKYYLDDNPHLVYRFPLLLLAPLAPTLPRIYQQPTALLQVALPLTPENLEVNLNPPVQVNLLQDKTSVAQGRNVSFYVHCVTWVHTLPAAILQVGLRLYCA